MRLLLTLALICTVAGVRADEAAILLHGREAKVKGTLLRYEPEPHKQTLGYWKNVEDAAEWTFAVAAAGEYEIEVLQGCGTGHGGSTMLVAVDAGRDGAAEPIEFIVEETGHFQAFLPRAVGRVTLSAGEHTLRIQPKTIVNVACCDIRQVRLVPIVPVAKPAQRPNILLIFADDHAQHALSCYGSKINTTPHLDRLAAAGTRFTNSFVTNSICSPSRATLLTGQYSHKNGVPVFNAFDGSRDHAAKRLQAAGYHTGMIGKWHLGTDPTGFDRWIVLPGQGDYWNPTFLVPDGRLTIEGHCTRITGDLGIEFLKTRPADKPFFLMLHHKAPHREWSPDRRNKEAFVEAEFPEATTLREYLASVQGVDDSVGKMLDFLDESGLAENTIVFYTTDNGWYLGDLGLSDKRFMHEPGLRVPLIARGPGIRRGATPDAFVANIDLAPTFLDLAGLLIPDSMQGKSLAPLLRGEIPAGWRQSVYYRSYHDPGDHDTRAHYGVRTATHKLIHYWKKDAWELFDLAADPHEQHNLLFDEAEASSRGVANTLAALKAELARLQREYQDDGLYADPATWPKAGVESNVESRPALGGKTVAEAIRLTARE